VNTLRVDRASFLAARVEVGAYILPVQFGCGAQPCRRNEEKLFHLNRPNIATAGTNDACGIGAVATRAR
jgi:hypothetical protein